VKRFAALALLVLLVSVASGCGSAGQTGSGSQEPTATVASGPYAAMPVTGPQEKAAAAALPKVLKAVAKSTTDGGNKSTDVGDAKPALIAYNLIAEVGDEVTLFEVRADGKAYALYRYPVLPDPKRLQWLPAAQNSGAFLATPKSDAELGAVAGVTSIVKIAKPGKKADVKISGYTFVWIGADGNPVKSPSGQVFTVTVDPKGSAASWSM